MSSSSVTAIQELPAVDDHLVAEDSGWEIDDGEIVLVSPAQEPHAERHAKLAALLEAHAAPEFKVAVDMLTRTSLTSDRAPDASVYPRARDPRTGGRQLEHLAFEVVSTETLGHAGRKAASLARRGVRRVFAIDVEDGRVLEWRGRRGWGALDLEGAIVDAALALPLPVRALLRDAEANDAVGRALVARRHPAIEAARHESEARGEARGEVRGMVLAILRVLAARAIELSAEEQAQILGERDPARLERWLERVATCASAAELLAAAHEP